MCKIKKSDLVSFIIPTFNSEKTIEDCLKSIKNQTYRNIEIIIVDNYSQDKTIKIAKKYDVMIIQVKSERNFARNLGARYAKGDFLLFLDSDMVLTPKVIEECVEKVIKNKVDAIIIPERSIGNGFIAKCKGLEKELRNGHIFSEAPRFFKKEVFFYVGGYDENLVTGDDFELGKRVTKAKFKIGKIKKYIIHNEGKQTIKNIVLKTYYYGKYFPRYFKKDPILAIQTSSPIRYFTKLNFIKKNFYLFIGIIIIKHLEYITYLIGIIAYIFNSKKKKI